MKSPSFSFNQPPEKAIEYFKSKGNVFSWDWYDTWQDAHTKAFTVAKVVRMDVLTDIRSAVQKSMEEGITFQEFKKQLEPTLQAKGWWGKATDSEGKEVQLGSPWRLKTIYETNLSTSYAAGRWKAITDNKESRPYLQYWTADDGRVRASHAILHGLVFPYNDPFWNSFYPPNDWGCRCGVRALSSDDIESEGLSVQSSERMLSPKFERLTGNLDNDRLTQVTELKNPETGETVRTGLGWNYNPGEVEWNPDLQEKKYGELIEQYKKDIDTNIKIAKEIDFRARNDIKDYFNVESNVRKVIFHETEEEFYRAVKMDKERDGIAGGVSLGDVIHYNPFVINNSRTGTIKNGIDFIVHENIHPSGKGIEVEIEKQEKGKTAKEIEKEKNMDRFVQEASTELLTKKFLLEKYNAKESDVLSDVYRQEMSDMTLQLISKYGTDKEKLWKIIEDGKFNNIKEFTKDFTFSSYDVSGQDYENILRKVRDKGLFTSQINNFLNINETAKNIVEMQVEDMKKNNYSQEEIKRLNLLKKSMINGIIKENKPLLEKNIKEEVMKWMIRK